jgi:hypothetical protein
MITAALKRVFVWTVALALALIMIRTFAQVRKDRPDRDEDEQSEQATKTRSRVNVQNGQSVITLDPKAQSRAGISVAPLVAITSREQVTAPAVVLSAQEIINQRNNYVSAAARLEKARASMDVSQKEFDRLKALYQDNQNASQKALEGAQGVLRSNQAETRAAQQDLLLQTAALRQSWGEVIAKWVVDDATPLDRVLEQHDMLVHVTMPPSVATSAAPETISLELPHSGYAQAKLISPFPRVDPRIQGVSFLYVTPSHLGLTPGINLVAHLAVGRPVHGVLVPQQAIVWWQGQAWVYEQVAPGRFIRQEVEASVQVEGEFFVTRGVSSEDRVVVSGAQTLLSAELGTYGQGGEQDTD